ncbi:hypothetical protein V8E53_010091 [Lactarius tabidus]
MDTTTEDGGEPLKSGPAVEDRQSAISNAQSQIDVLTDLSRRLQALRQFPDSLLRSEHISGENQVLQGPLSSTVKGSFSKYVEDLRTLHVAMVEEKAQDVLRAAAESERKDSTAIKDTREKEKESQKRKRSPTPESPRPYLALENKVSSPFPPLTADELLLTLKDLPAYVREFNATHTKTLLHVYVSSGREPHNVAVPVVLRFLIPDVLRAFITLGHEEGSNGAVSETSALMGIHVFTELQKPPHSQSEFTVFQKLSQWVVRMLQLSPRVPVQSFMSMLVAYESLFLEKCPLCQRFLSAEGYLPPVARVRRDDGTWEPRHATCVQN